MATSFRGLGIVSTYFFGATLALLMALPAMISRSRWPLAIVMIIADLLAVANLMYCRTYFGPIPPASYLLAGNVAEFGDAIRHSLRWGDIAFPVITLLTLFGYRFDKKLNRWRPYRMSLIAGIISCVVCAVCYDGVFTHIEKLKAECYYRATPPVAYTLPVSIVADLLESNKPISKEEITDARQWLKDAKKYHKAVAADTIYQRRYQPDNLVMILVESLESWPIDKKIEGKEITPNLNRFLSDTASTWIARRVLSQVGPGRSIDGQLLMTTGLMPMADYVYSMRFPDRTYPHLAQALKQTRDMKSYLLSGDRATTWNQGAMVMPFEIDEAHFRDFWDASESFGHPRNPSDGSFLRQVATKMKDGHIWPTGEKSLVEVITYSSHFPFTIPEEYRKIKLNGSYPEPLADYITAINYTDSALGEFIDYLRSRQDSDKTMIVIVGDHEALATWRDPIRNADKQLAEIVDADSFVPMIVLNSPIVGQRTDVMGQVDVYSTIIDLMGVKGNPDVFSGLGISAFSSNSPKFAYDLNCRLVGDTVAASAELIEHVASAAKTSSTIIRADLLKK
jgi:phosphoglycerol transferase MdoB-like AlkP superfamily enzyme